TGNVIAGCRRGTIRAGERALVFIFYALFILLSGGIAAHTARQLSRGSLSKAICGLHEMLIPASPASGDLPFLSRFAHVKTCSSASKICSPLPRLLKPRKLELRFRDMFQHCC